MENQILGICNSIFAKIPYFFKMHLLSCIIFYFNYFTDVNDILFAFLLLKKKIFFLKYPISRTMINMKQVCKSSLLNEYKKMYNIFSDYICLFFLYGRNSHEQFWFWNFLFLKKIGIMSDLSDYINDNMYLEGYWELWRIYLIFPMYFSFQ